MTEETAELWARAEDCDEELQEVLDRLARLNRRIDWDRPSLVSSAADPRLRADD